MAPAVLVAARAQYLASPEFAAVSPLVGTGPAPIGRWVFVDVDPRTGLPAKYGQGSSAVAFYLRSGSWHTNDTSARYPILAATVWAQGDSATRDAEYQALDVADSLIAAFRALAHTFQWAPTVYVNRCHWSGELSVFEAENLPGIYRAEVSFELEVV